jgi:uncharacterized protein YdeI (YjbR/CyaY-like superfamily)
MEARPVTKELRPGLPILAFADAGAFEAWLASQPRASKGLWLKLAKKRSGRASISKSDAIDAALCHGSIDGQIDKYDDTSWLVRFTPRKRASKWSELNCKRALALISAGRMQAAGLAEVEAAKADGRWQAAYAPARTAAVPADLQAALNASPRAAAFFATLNRANRYAIVYRVQTAKKADTRKKRIADFHSRLTGPRMRLCHFD